MKNAPEKRAPVTVLSYAACGTCKKAMRWLDEHGVKYTVRPIVDERPTEAELVAWIAASGLPARKWFNTSGQSYRTLTAEKGKDAVDAATDSQIVRWLAADGKLVKRPVLVRARAVHGSATGAGEGAAKGAPDVLVGFREGAYAELL